MQTPEVLKWSTDSVDAPQRFDYYADALRTALVPMRLTAPHPQGFRSVMNLLDLGSVSVLRQEGTARRCYRESKDPAFERAFVIVSNLSGPCDVSHRGRSSLQAGDVLLVDTGYDFDLDMGMPYSTVGIKLSEGWMRQWLPSPAAMVGRRIPTGSGWGRALASFVAQLSPQLFVNSPLPRAVLIDHVGALLMLMASEAGWIDKSPSRPERGLRNRIIDCVAQRSAEAGLTAADVAQSIGISTRTLHRSLATTKETFGAALLSTRADVATRMLESPLMRRLTIAEIGRRAGFSDPSHFARVLRRRSGRTPKQIRADATLSK